MNTYDVAKDGPITITFNGEPTVVMDMIGTNTSPEIRCKYGKVTYLFHPPKKSQMTLKQWASRYKITIHRDSQNTDAPYFVIKGYIPSWQAEHEGEELADFGCWGMKDENCQIVEFWPREKED